MDQYRLLAGISSGRIDHDDYGSFEIEDGEVVVEDYDTARSLVRRYPLLGWDGDDPGRPDDSDEDAEAEAEAESESEEQELEAESESESEDESESEPADEGGEDGDEDADAEADVEDEDEDREIYTCAGMDGDCTRRVDEPGGYCWQHED